jgi:hypothetical protein
MYNMVINRRLGQLAILAAIIMLDVGELWMKERRSPRSHLV